MATYKIYDKRRPGRLIATLSDVLAAVTLSSVATTSGSNVITCASTTGVYPGMMIACPGIPHGAAVKAVKNSTTLELHATIWTAGTTQAFSLSEANANASATASSLTAYAYGFNEVPQVRWVPRSTWRNLIRAPGFISASAYWVDGVNNPFTTVPTLNPGAITALETVTSDELKTTPALRHKMSPEAVWSFVGTGGAHQAVGADPVNDLVILST